MVRRRVSTITSPARLGRVSFLREWLAGRNRRLWTLLAAGLICGVLWEFWNFWSASKWVYSAPFTPGLKYFEEAKQPGILDWSVIDDVVRVDDDPAYTMTKRLWREEGLMVGPSTGAVVVAAQQYGLDSADIAVGVSPDSGLKYTSYFAELLGDDGLPTT